MTILECTGSIHPRSTACGKFSTHSYALLQTPCYFLYVFWHFQWYCKDNSTFAFPNLRLCYILVPLPECIFIIQPSLHWYASYSFHFPLLNSLQTLINSLSVLLDMDPAFYKMQTESRLTGNPTALIGLQTNYEMITHYDYKYTAKTVVCIYSYCEM